MSPDTRSILAQESYFVGVVTWVHMRTVTFNREKFRELIVYIAQKTGDDPGFGDTHLNKVLYWSDFFGYSHLGQPVTGARYQKLKYGPAARALIPVRDELEEEGALSVEPRQVGTMESRVTIAKRGPDTSLFSPEELELVDELISQVKTRTAISISALSHQQSPGWNLVDIHEDIPYSTALISTEKPSGDVVARGKELTERFGW